MINEYIREGKIVPAEVTVGLLRKAMDASGSTRFLVDGFPRNIENLTCWNDVMSSVAEVSMLLNLDCPEEVMERRLLERGKSSGRIDDNIESIRKRFKTFRQETMPIIQHFESLGKTRTVNADRSVDEVFGDVVRHIRAAYPGL